MQSLANGIDCSADDQRLEPWVSLSSKSFDASYVADEPLPQRIQDQELDIAGPAVRGEEGVEASAPVVEGLKALLSSYSFGV